MDQAFPSGEVFPPYPYLGVGIKAATFDPSAAIVVQAVHREHFVVGDVLFFEFVDGLLQFVGEHFVGIDAEDEVAGGEVVGEVFWSEYPSQSWVKNFTP